MKWKPVVVMRLLNFVIPTVNPRPTVTNLKIQSSFRGFQFKVFYARFELGPRLNSKPTR